MRKALLLLLSAMGISGALVFIPIVDWQLHQRGMPLAVLLYAGFFSTIGAICGAVIVTGAYEFFGSQGRLQFHLGTLVLVIVAIGLLMFLNTTPRETHWTPSGGEGKSFGFPFTAWATNYYEPLINREFTPVDGPFVSSGPFWGWGYPILNGLFALAVVFGIASASEIWLYHSRRELKSSESPELKQP
jgi:hypothetical protein